MHSLEMLAPELLLQILQELLTLSDLIALVKASSRLYQVYLLNKGTVLSAIARRQFHPAVMSDALFFAQISQLERPLSREVVLDLCKTYPVNLRETTTTIAMSVAMCKLAENVNFFIEDYARNTLPLLEELGRSLDVKVMPEYWPENPVSYCQLSESEVGRLQRAFCRFEIYRYLFARCYPELDHEVHECADLPAFSCAEQVSLLLEKFPDFQVAEINCIRDYFFRRLRGLFNRLEDQVFHTFPPETFEFDQRGDIESQEWSSGVWLFCDSGKGYQNEHIEHLMTLGLAYTRRIFESTGKEQRELFIRNKHRSVLQHIERDFISSSIESLGRNPRRGDIPLLAKTDPPFVYEINPEAGLDIPDVWQWAYPRAPPFDLSELSVKGLRDWGYVFWDLGRLKESGILKRSKDDVRMIRFDEFEASQGPSVQERLIGPLDYPEVSEYGVFNIDDYRDPPTFSGSESDASELPEVHERPQNSHTSDHTDNPNHSDLPPLPQSDSDVSEASEAHEGLAEISRTNESTDNSPYPDFLLFPGIIATFLGHLRITKGSQRSVN